MDPNLFHVGNLDHHLGDWMVQHVPDHDATSAQVDVINACIGGAGHHVSPHDANYMALANGWHATGMQDVGHLLDAYGVSNHRVENASIGQLLGELQEGHRVIVGLANDHATPSGPLLDLFHSLQERLGLGSHGTPSHAVSIKEVDVSDPQHPQIILHDPSQSEGATMAYPLDRFVDAWKGSQFSYVATDVPPGGSHHHEHHLLSDILGWGAGLATFHWTGSPQISLATGKLVNAVTDKMWDAILTAI